MYCIKCGKKFAEESKFCNECGMIIQKNDNISVPGELADAAQDGFSDKENSNAVKKKQLKFSVDIIIAIIIVMGLIFTNPSPDKALTWSSKNISMTETNVFGRTTKQTVPDFMVGNVFSVVKRNNYFLFSVYQIDVNVSAYFHGTAYRGVPKIQSYRILGIAGQFIFI
jgi:hypothetical protein